MCWGAGEGSPGVWLGAAGLLKEDSEPHTTEGALWGSPKDQSTGGDWCGGGMETGDG